MKGLFITFEGPDGSGKTTQMRRLVEQLTGTGGMEDVVVTREPGGTAIGNRLREMVLSPEYTEMEDETEVLLYAASRAQHVREVILPALAAGKVVLCDRFVDASIAYQGFGLGIEPETIAAVNRFATGGLQPDRTYLLDVPAEVSRERLLQRAREAGGIGLDRIEQREQDYHERVREGFLHIARKEQQRVLVIRADRPIGEIAAEIGADFNRLLKQRKL